jgi:hypothetical protein
MSNIVPYVIEHSECNDAYTNESNKFTTYDCIEKNKLHDYFISIIVEIMYEFCHDKYGHGINVTSYSNFCEKYYEQHGRVEDTPLFTMRYFEDGDWHEWRTYTYASEIYTAYMYKTAIPSAAHALAVGTG